MGEPEEFTTKNKCMVLKLKKSLYGLKQSARNWQIFLSEFIFAANYFPLLADSCVFKAKSANKETISLICTHVDDIFVLFNSKGKPFRDSLWEALKRKVEIENLGPVSWALKTHIMRDRELYSKSLSRSLCSKPYSKKGHQTPGPSYFPLF